jgi:uncharacterized membrane protein YgcG
MSFRHWFYWGLAALTLVTVPVSADERILSFESDITVNADGWITVRETITVRSETKKIKRGIYRDFPVRYTTPAGDRYRVDFEVVEVQREGVPESYHVQSRGNDERVYIGKGNTFLNPGVYTYRLTYRTHRQLGFFENHDELYWNVTGNQWAFPIDRVEARVALPNTVAPELINTEAYVGRFGETGGEYEANVDVFGVAAFTATRTLRQGEGLTIVVTWPKGHVHEPSTAEQWAYFARDNRNVLLGVVGVSILLLYFFVVWSRVGRDPDPGVIVPLFEPPLDLSPAAMRYILKMGFDNKAYSAAVINLAVKGYLSISDDDDEYVLTRNRNVDKSVLSPGERRLAAKLFRGGKTAVLKRANHKSIRGSIKALKNLLRNEYHLVYFRTNGKYLIPGILIAVATIIVSGYSSVQDKGGLFFMIIWLTGWTFTIYILITQGQYLMAAIFGVFEVGALVMLATEIASVSVTGLLILLIVINIVFFYLIKAPTQSGRKLMDAIEGFKLYLSVAEKERLNTLNPPEQTPELFEKYLPYALALGVDQEWSERFAETLHQAASDGSDYRPRWYSGSSWEGSDFGRFSSSLSSSLTSAVSSSSQAPGSSSGSGGGGSSGGGGGGGGGGGW